MTRIGDDEPALVGPWTMGRDKKNPKPLDQPAFLTLVKTASEVLRRHEQSARARLHRSITFVDDEPSTEGSRRIRADLDLAPRRRGSACDPGALRRRDERTASKRTRGGELPTSTPRT